jgi:MFS transporter, MHS family, proline/betaine transporter
MESWGWRVPFFAGSLIALLAPAIPTQVRETPLFDELLSEGKTVRSPLREGLRRPMESRASHVRYGCLPRSLLLPRRSLRADVPCIVCKGRPRRSNARGNGGERFQHRLHRDPRMGLGQSRTQTGANAGYIGFLLFSYPFYVLLSSGHIVSMLVAAVGFVVLAACFMGSAMTAARSISRPRCDLAGCAFGYNVGSGLFGGFTRLVAGWLIHAGALTAPSYYIMAASAIFLGLCFRLRATRGLI